MRQGVRKIAFVGEPDLEVAEALREYGYRVDAIDGDSVFGLARQIYKIRPTLVHAKKGHLRAALVAKLYGRPFIAQVARGDVSAPTAHAARMAERTICGGASVREALLQLGAPASSTSVIRSLLDIGKDLHAAATFPPMLDPTLRWIVAASPADGPDRGHSDLLLAFFALARTRPKLKLLIAGDGQEGRKLRLTAEQAGMLSRVVVHPLSLEQLPAVFAHAAVVVGPSRTNAPDPVPEALAVGAPVVATAIGPHPTWIREGKTGWLVPPRAPGALAARLAQVLDDPEHARKVGNAARHAAVELASPRAVAQELARCYAAVGGIATPSRGLYLPVSSSRLSRA